MGQGNPYSAAPRYVYKPITSTGATGRPNSGSGSPNGGHSDGRPDGTGSNANTQNTGTAANPLPFSNTNNADSTEGAIFTDRSGQTVQTVLNPQYTAEHSQGGWLYQTTAEDVAAQAKMANVDPQLARTLSSQQKLAALASGGDRGQSRRPGMQEIPTSNSAQPAAKVRKQLLGQ